jgi:hypothetical protein
MEEFKGPYAISLFTGLISVLVSYMENKMNETGRTNKDYLKLFLLVSLCTLLVLSVLNMNPTSITSSFKDQEILTGNPNF